MCHRSASLLLLSFLFAAACGGATAPVGDAPSSTGSSGGSGGDGAGSGKSTTTTTAGDTSNGGGTSSSGGVKDAGGPQACNAGAACPADEWCDRGKGVCSGSGVCTKRPPPPPPACPAYPDMLCGCDGRSYCSEEDANAAGVAIAVYGSCTVACGPSTCDALTQYCDHGSGGVALPDGGSREAWTCKSFAAAGCAEDRTCACVQKGPGAGTLCNETGGHVQTEELWP